MNNPLDFDAAGIKMHHVGDTASFYLEVTTPANKIIIRHENANEREVVIRIECNTIESVVPSIEGSVLWVRTVTGHESFYDTLTGTALSAADLAERNQHFWGE